MFDSTASAATTSQVRSVGTVVFHLKGDPSELAGVTEGAAVTPLVGPAGAVSKNGTGSVQFAPAVTGSGIYFLSCCTNANNASLRFTGAQLGNLFDPQGGEINFNLTSRQNWANRKVRTYSTVYTVQDAPGNNLYSFIVAPSAGRLSFSARTGSASTIFYYVPAGQEDAIFGDGKSVSIRIAWDGSKSVMYINGSQAAAASYRPATPAWAAGSRFTIGGNYTLQGTYNVSEDILDELIVSKSSSGTGPSSPSAPLAPANVSAALNLTKVDLTWTAAAGAASYRVFRNGSQIGQATATAFSDLAPPAASTLSYQVATVDAAGQVSALSQAASVTTPPSPATPPSTTPATFSVAANTWVSVTPTYSGAPAGGKISPSGWNSMGVYDPATKRTIVFDRWNDSARGGSIYANGVLAYDPVTNNVEVLKLGNWYVKTTSTGSYTTEALAANATEPTPVDRHSFGGLGLDPVRNQVYLVNGLNQTSAMFPRDTWKLDLTSRKWSVVATSAVTHPPNDGGKFGSLVFDPSAGKFVQFVGTNSGTETWVLDPAAGTWSALPRHASATTVWISGAGVAFDSVRNRIVAYGGGVNYWNSSPQLYAYSLATNTWTRLKDGPTAVSAAEFAYDSRHDVFLALSGSETLSYDPKTDSWRRIPTPSSIVRGKITNFQNLTYNQAQDVFVFQGGTFDRPAWSLFRYDAATLPAAPGDTSAPSIPTGLTATGISSSQIQLTWTPSTDNAGVAGYRVFTNGSARGTTTTPSYTEIGLIANMNYTFMVAAYDATGNVSAPSVQVIGRTLAAGTGTVDTTPPVISAVTVTNITASSATVSWTTNELALGQVAYGVSTALGTSTPLAATTATSHSVTLSGLTASTTYHYQVKSVDPAGNTGTGTVLSFATIAAGTGGGSGGGTTGPDTQAPTIPGGVTAIPASQTQIQVRWTASTDNVGVTAYRVYRNNAQVGSINATSYTDSGLTASTSYSYQVAAVDAAGNLSARSATVSATTLATVSTTEPPFVTPSPGTLSVPLTVQEATYPGSVPGITRISDPLTVGVPIADAAGITSESQLALVGSSAAQFRILGRWPSGNAKWVLVDTQADVAAGGQNVSLSLIRGSTSTGTNLAVDQGATIAVNTGAAQFRIRKANFNGLDSVVVNGKTIVAAGTSQGFVVTGPAPGQTACTTPCTELYTSANDPASTAVIEENGPVRTVIRATGYHRHATGALYMGFTVRLTFFKGKQHVKINTALRNADYGTSNTFASAYKGFESYDLQITNALAGGKQFAFGTHTTPLTGTVSGSDSVYLYQGTSESLRHAHWCGFGCVPFTADTGYQIVKNGTPLVTGLTTGGSKEYPQGWADIADSSGAGIGVGVYQLSALWPKSLEFNNGGSDVRIGIWARQNSIPYYQVWPQHSIHDLYVNFHDTTVADPAGEFLKFQHYLLARAHRQYYNYTKVFPYPLINQTEEDDYYKTVAATATPTLAANRACCVADFGSVSSTFALSVFRFFGWRSAGGGAMGNQSEFRWSFLMNFLARGYTGRYLLSAHFYRYQAEHAFPRSDGFQWRDSGFTILDAWGFPGQVVSQNSTLAHRNWIDQEHAHWYGMMDYYFLTGDQGILDAIQDGAKDRYLNPNTTVNNPQMNASSGLYNSRSVGAQLMATARMYEFFKSIGDPDADRALAQGQKTYDMQVKPDLCVSGYPVGCNPGALDSLNGGGIDSGTRGVSRVRGIPWGPAGRSGTFCNTPHMYRVNSVLQGSILVQGIWEFLKIQGPGWAEYENALDLAYGISQWALTEAYHDDGSGNWSWTGYRFGLGLDVPNACDVNYSPYTGATVWFPFYLHAQVEGNNNWEQRFQTVLRKNMGNTGIGSTDFVTFQTAILIDKIKRPTGPVMTDVPVTVTAAGSGSYQVSWTVPARAVSYRLKWGTKRIVPWIGFDAGTNVFIGDPVNTMNWFAANNVSGEPAPAAAGTVQSFTVTGLPAGLSTANFWLKAYVQ